MNSDTKDKEYNYQDLIKQGTGVHDESEDYKIIIYPFDKYQIKIKLTTNDKFLEIIEIKINKDFLSLKQKLASQGVHDIDEFYREK